MSSALAVRMKRTFLPLPVVNDCKAVWEKNLSENGVGRIPKNLLPRLQDSASSQEEPW